MGKTFCDLIEIIHFTENVSAKIHGLPDEAAIYRTMMEEFAQSERYTASILLLRDDGSKLGIAETSIAPEKLQAGEETAGVRLKAYKIDLSKSSIFSPLVREGKTLQVNVSDVIRELFPRPLAYLISKTMGYEQKLCILTPLRRQGKIIGALAVSSPALADYFVPSVRNLAQHISTALELAHEHVERRQVDEELREYRDRLEELVEERTAELKQSNEQLHREITERKRAEEALKESESRRSGILSSMVDLVFAFDAEGRFIFHHAPRIEDLYVPPGEFIGKKPLEVMPAHLNDLFVEAFERSRKGEVAEFEYWLEIGGRVRWFFAKLSPVLLEGEFTGSVAIIREITERRRVEEALRGSEERYLSLFTGVPVGINLTTPEGQILDANPALVEMLGYPNREALLAVNATDLYVDPADRRQWQALIQREGVVRGFEVQLRRCDGTTMLVRSNARAVCDANGRVVCYEGSLEDITERKRAEEALRESEEKFRSLVSTAPDGIVLTDAQGTIVELNEAYAQLYGYERDEMLGKSFLEFIPRSESRARAEQMFQVLQETGSIPHQEVPILTKTGAQVPVELAVATLRNDSGQLTGLVAIIRDITERRQAEEALRQRTAQLEALRQVDLEIAAELDLDSLLHSIASQAVELVGGTAGGLYLYRPDLDKLMWVTSVGPNMAPAGTILHRGEGLSGKVWETGKPLIVDDYQHWESRAAIYEGYPWTAVVGVPVYWGEKFLGVLNVLTDAPRTFSPADAELLTLLATQAAIAIRNVCLFEGELEQRELVGSLGEAAAVITSTLDLDQVLDRILEQVSRVVPNDAANIMFIEGDRARVVRCHGYERFGTEELVSTLVFHIPETVGFEQMIESKEPMVVPDIATFPGWVQVQEWLRSYAAAPIVVRGEVIGFLNVDSATPGFFTQADAEVLRAFADHAAAAIENARLYATQQQRAQESSLLLDVANTINSTLDMTGVLKLVAQRAAQVCGADRCTVLLLDDAGKTLIPAMSQFAAGTVDKKMWQLFKDSLYPRLLAEAQEVQQVFQEGCPLFIPDALASSVPRYWIEPFNVKSLLVVPMISKGRGIGVMGLDHMEEGRGFTDEQVNLARIIGAQAAIAIENARLYAEARRRLKEQTALREAGAFISSTLDPQTVLSRIAEQMCRAVDATSAYISGYDPMTKTASVLAEHIGPHACPQEQVSDLGVTYVEDAGDEWLEMMKSGQYDISHVDAPDLIESELAHMQQFGVQTILYIPLRIKGQLIGYAEIWESRQRREFTPEEIALCQGIAQQAAIALENARLYEQAHQEVAERKRTEKALKRRAAQLATVNKIGQQIASILDLGELLRQIVDLLEEAFSYRYVYILLLDEDSNELVARAGAGAGRVLEGTRIPVEARSINARVARTGEPFLANDVSKEPLYLLLEEIADTKSELCVPIRIKDQVMGTLDVQSTKSNAFDESDLFTLQALAGQAGIAIENARLYEESRHRLSELSTIHEISMAATSTMDFNQALERAAAAMQRILNFQAFGFLLLDESTGELHFHPSYRGIDPEMADKLDLRLGKGITGWVAETSQPLLVPDVSQDPRYFDAVADTRSEMCVPLKIGERVIGVINVESDQVNAFSEDDLRLLSTLAGQVATTIENAHLFAETEGKANDLALLLDTSTAISSTLDLDQILETVAHQITTSLMATFCRISLLDETGENLVIRAVSPVRGWKAEGGFRQPYPLTMVPWHKQVIETAEPVILRQDVPELALSDEELKAALTDGVKSAVLIPLIVGGRVLGVIAIGEERGWERSPFTREKVELCQSIAFQAAVAIENAYLYEELQQSFLQTIAALAAAVDAKDRYTGGHSQRTTKLAATIAEELGLSEEDIELTRYASLLHDVGKIGISERILSKPGPLDEKEWSQIHRHPALGADIVERAASLQKLGPIILYHHERYDGQGYPAGLSGEDIPLKARILAVADAYEAMTSERTYRPAMTVEQALATLRDGADKQWDGEVVEVLIRIIREQGEQGYHSEPDQPPNVSVGPYDVLVWRKGLSESL